MRKCCTQLDELNRIQHGIKVIIIIIRLLHQIHINKFGPKYISNILIRDQEKDIIK